MPDNCLAESCAPPRKRQKPTLEHDEVWMDWPAPRSAMEEARQFMKDIVDNGRSVLIVPDKDADGLSGRCCCVALLAMTTQCSGHTPVPYLAASRII